MRLLLCISFLLPLYSAKGGVDSTVIKSVEGIYRQYLDLAHNNVDSAFFLLDSMAELSKRNNYDKGLRLSIRERGLFYSERGDYLKSASLLFSVLKMDEEAKDEEGQAEDMMFIGLNYYYQEKDSEALLYLEKSKQKYVDQRSERGVAITNANLGMIYRNLNQFEKSLQYYTAAKDFYEKVGNEKNIGNLENNIGNVYKDLKQYDKALQHFFIAEEIKTKFKMNYSLIPTLSNIADVYVEKGNYEKAFPYYAEAQKLATEQRSLSLRKDVHFDLAYAYEKQGNYKKAFENMKAYSELKDSTLSEEYDDELAEMKVKYESDKKENENVLLKKDNELQGVKISEEKKQKVLFASLFGIVFVAVVLVFMQYRNKQKLNAQLAEINEKVQNQNSTLRILNKELIESEEKLTQANATKDQLISMLSHDLYNPVTSVINYTNLIIGNEKEMTKEELGGSFVKVNAAVVPLQDLLENILQWARNQKGEIVPLKEKVELKGVLEEIIALYQPAASFKNVKINVISKKLPTLQTDRLMLFFILRNIINNAVKFCAVGKNIEIESTEHGSELCIFIRDEGTGFSEGVLKKLNSSEEIEAISEGGSGIGLSVSRKFIRSLKGEILFSNKKDGTGAEVLVKIPLL